MKELRGTRPGLQHRDILKLGVDYEETFASVAKLNFIRVLLSLAANLDWELHQMDVNSTFLNGELEEEIYMKIPLGFEKEELE